MYTVMGYRGNSLRHVIESDSLARLVSYARGWTRNEGCAGADWCTSAVVCRGDANEAGSANAIAIVTGGQVWRVTAR
jgi:hypothetical protein